MGGHLAVRAELARALPLDMRWQEPQAVTVVDETGSTNADLVEFARTCLAERGPLPERMLRIARRQSAGRGRLTRSWRTPVGAGLAMSIGLSLPLAPARLGGFALVCGLAAHAALADFGLDVRLKWPNDIVDRQRHAKLGGILVELVQLAADRTWVVVGIGLNLRGGAALEGELGRAVGDLETLAGMSIEADLLAARIVAQLETRLPDFERAGFAPYAEVFDRVHALHERAVSVLGAPGIAGGQCVGVDRRGEVLVRRADGRLERLLSGEVSLAETGA